MLHLCQTSTCSKWSISQLFSNVYGTCCQSTCISLANSAMHSGKLDVILFMNEIQKFEYSIDCSWWEYFFIDVENSFVFNFCRLKVTGNKMNSGLKSNWEKKVFVSFGICFDLYGMDYQKSNEALFNPLYSISYIIRLIVLIRMSLSLMQGILSLGSHWR